MFSSISPVLASQSSCIQCHISSDWVSDTTIAERFLERDVHKNFSLDCSDCHGGDSHRGFAEADPELAMDPAKGYKSLAGRLNIPEFCAGCHSDIEYMKKYNPRLPTDQLRLYRTSIHGKRLFNNKDPKAAICTDCHGVHGILPSSDSRSLVYHNNIPSTCKTCHSDKEYMKDYKYDNLAMPTDQFDEYKESVHGKMVLEQGDKSAPSCNNCHGNHGATPPNLSSVSAACGECHANNQKFFNNSPHKQAWAEMDLPECEQCHGNHLIKPALDELIGIGDQSLCIECHDRGSPGYVAAAKMKADIDSLKEALNSTEELISRARQKGVESGEAEFEFSQVRDALITIQSVIHTFDPERVAEIQAPAVEKAQIIKLRVVSSLRDIWHRQIGLGVSLILVLIIVVGLWRKIKEVDRNLK
jgi:hypothetical protein